MSVTLCTGTALSVLPCNAPSCKALACELALIRLGLCVRVCVRCLCVLCVLCLALGVLATFPASELSIRKAMV